MEIIDYMDAVYNRLKFERIYFSAYQPGLGAPDIPGERNFSLKPEDHLTREHRLYQCDFLLRRYGFEKNDLIFGADGNLNLDRDPKQVWADNHPEYFPVKLNSATKNDLLRIPGIGPETAKKIIEYRKIHQLKGLGDIGLKGAQLTKAGAYCR